MNKEKEIESAFMSVWEALGPREQRKSLKSSMRSVANGVKKIAADEVRKETFGQGTLMPLTKSLRVRVYSGGGGFLVTAKPRGEKGIHVNRNMQRKPVLLFLQGTKARKTKTRTKYFIRLKRGHSTGFIAEHNFMDRAENSAVSYVENEFMKKLEAAAERRLAKLGVL